MTTIAPPAPPGPPPSSPHWEESRRPERPESVENLGEQQPSTRKPIPPWIVDGVGILVLGTLALWGFVASFGTMGLVVGVVGLAVVLAWTLLVSVRGWPTWIALVGGVVAYVVIGSIMAVPNRAAAGVLPTPGSASLLFVGALTGWSAAVVTRPPIGRLDDLLAVPLVCGVLIGVISTLLARRNSYAVYFAVVPPIAVFLAAILIGTDSPVSILQGSLIAVVAVAWLAAVQTRRRTGGLRSATDVARLRRLVLLLVVALGIGTLLGNTSLVSGGSHREVIRDSATPPVDERLQASPLAEFRQLKLPESLGGTALFTVSGLRAGQRVRLAVLDYYDGVNWQTTPSNLATDSSATFERVGTQLPVTSTGSSEQTIHVTDDGYQGVWMPSVGDAAAVSFVGGQKQTLTDGLRYNVVNGSLAEPSGLVAGDSYTLTSAATDTPTPSQAPVVLPQGITKLVDGIPGDPWQQLVAVTAKLRKGNYSDGLPNQTGSDPGETEYRLEQFINDYASATPNQESGDAEQYAAVLALLARERGLPARVVVGFTPSQAGTSTIYGRDVTAWVEVYHQGAWRTLDPTPPKDQDVKITKPPQQFQPQPVPLQAPPASPPAPVSQARPLKAKGSNSSGCGGSGSCAFGLDIPGWVAPVVGIPLLIVGVFAAVTLGLAGVKRSRRNRRRGSGSPADQVSGGWDELCDLIRDTGGILPANATRRESAVLVNRPGIALAAQRTDALVFGPHDVTPDMSASYWRDVDATRAGILASLSRVDRWKATVSLSSLQIHAGASRLADRARALAEEALTWTKGLTGKLAR